MGYYHSFSSYLATIEPILHRKINYERLLIVPKVPLLPNHSFVIVRQTIINNLARLCILAIKLLMYQTASCGNGFLGFYFFVTYNNLFNYWTIKQTKLIKKWMPGKKCRCTLVLATTCGKAFQLTWSKTLIVISQWKWIYTGFPYVHEKTGCSCLNRSVCKEQSLCLQFSLTQRKLTLYTLLRLKEC